MYFFEKYINFLVDNQYKFSYKKKYRKGQDNPWDIIAIFRGFGKKRDINKIHILTISKF